MSAYNSPPHISLAVDNSRSSIRLINNQILRGCNVYHTSTVIRQRVDLGILTGLRTSEAGPDFASRFIDRFSTLEKLTPEGQLSTDILQRLVDPNGVPFEQALFEAILAVDSSVAFVMRNLGTPDYREMFPTRSPGVIEMVWGCTVAKISRLAAIAGTRGLTELLPDELRVAERDDAQDFETLMAKLLKSAKRRQRSITAEALALAAKRRGLPCDFIGGSYLRLGQGFAQFIIHSSFAGQTTESTLGHGLESAEIDLPRPQQQSVTNPEDARSAANKLGYPVALKPIKGRHTPGDDDLGQITG